MRKTLIAATVTALCAASGVAAAGTTMPAAHANARAAATSPLADGVRFVEVGHSAEYISWFGASLPLTKADADAYSAEGDTNVVHAPPGYLADHPASAFPANREVRVVGGANVYVDDGGELLPVHAATEDACAARLGQPRIAVVPRSWALAFAHGPVARCLGTSTDGAFTRVEQYAPPSPNRPGYESEEPDALAPRDIVGDFNGDGRADLLSYAPGGAADQLWLGTPAGFVLGPNVSVYGIYNAVVGDYNGDGIDDILWLPGFYVPGGAGETPQLWYGSHSGSVFAHAGAMPTNPTSLPIVGDFNGDGRTDLFWWTSRYQNRPVTRALALWQGSAHGFHVVSLLGIAPVGTTNVTAMEPFAGDYDGDGKADVLWASAAGLRLWRGTASGFRSIAAPAPPDRSNLIGVDDFNGDHRTDLLWSTYNPYPKQRTTIWYGTASGFSSLAGPTVYVYAFPIFGDFNGDGRTDIYWWTNDSTTGHTLWYGAAHGFSSGPVSVDEPGGWSVADFNGDGKSDIVWWQFLDTLPSRTQIATVFRSH
jgi:hypothetical protein